MSRRKFICGNWKMHKTAGEAVQLVRELRQKLDGAGAQVGVAPPFTALAAVKQALQGSAIQLFGQNCVRSVAQVTQSITEFVNNALARFSLIFRLRFRPRCFRHYLIPPNA